MKKVILTLLAACTFAFAGYGKGPAQKYIEQQLQTDSLFNNAIIGIMAVNKDGKVIAEWNSNLPMLTASTMKTITTGVGLNLLGPDFKFSTKVAYSGEISDEGILTGDIYIIGGGDPTLGSSDEVAFDIDSIFGVWKAGLEKAGIKEVRGNIVADDSYFTRELIPDSWSWGNLGADYGSGTSGLCFHENTQEFMLTPGAETSDSVKIDIIYPIIPGQEVINNLKTGEAGTGDRSWYYLDDITRTAQYAGSIAADKGPVKSVNSSRFPHLSCAWHFGEFLVGKINSVIIFLPDLHTLRFCLDISASISLSPASYDLCHTICLTGRNHRAAGLYDAGFILRDLCYRIPEYSQMIPADAGKYCAHCIFNDVGGIQLASKSGLQHNQITLHFLKI